MEVKPIPLKPTVKKKPSSMEGVLVDKNGNIIYDDSWMHEDVMNEDSDRQKKE